MDHAAALIPASDTAFHGPPPDRDTIPGMEHEAWIVPLTLRHPFGLSRGSADELPTVLLRLTVGDQAPGSARPRRSVTSATAPAERLPCSACSPR
jgi:hypothetical protein